MDLYKKIIQFIDQHNLMSENSKIVIGLSGGPDSIFLLHFLAHYKKERNISFITAHLDHEWRAHSYKDVEFCHEVSQKLNIPFISGKTSQLNVKLKFNGSLEERGRIIRRHFFETVAKEHNADSIALAHHLTDQQETFFIRLIRGSSLTGLTTMRPKHGMYIRPLLEVDKSLIVEWLENNKVPYLTDPTNYLPTFLRNRIRNTVLPVLKECDNRFDINFLTTLNRLKETEDFLEQHTQELFKLISSHQKEKLVIDISHFFSLHQTIQNRVLLLWLIKENVSFTPSQSFLDEIVRFFKQPHGGKHAIHENWVIIKKQSKAFIKKFM